MLRSLASLVVLASLGMLAACGSTAPAEALGHTASRETSDNDKVAFDFFLAKGLSPEQAAGIVGNLDQESGMDPEIEQSGGGPGRGIAQWSAGGRWDTGTPNCTDYAADQGKDVLSLDLQLDFIWYELNQVPAYGLEDLRAATTVEDAVQIFQDKYEICGQCAEGNRLRYAQAALDAFGGDTPAATTDPGPQDPPDRPDPTTDPPGSTPDPPDSKSPTPRHPWPLPPKE